MKKILFILISFLITIQVSAQTSTSAETPVKKKVVKRKGITPKDSKKNKGKNGKDKVVKEKKVAPPVMMKPIYKNGKMITGNISTMEGFRVCIYSGLSRADAIAAKQTFMKSNSKFQSYLSYSSPYYRIKVGDFENKKVASNEMKKLQKTFPQSIVVPDLVTVKNIIIERVR